jgi:multiple sugar transport system permease protein
MSLSGSVGKKSWRARFAMGVVYLLLSLGAVTTVVPFLVMVSTSLKGTTDQNDNKLIPRYFTEVRPVKEDWSKPDATLLGKYLDDKYQGNPSVIQSTRLKPQATAEEIAKYEQFLMDLPVTMWLAGFRQAGGQVTSKLTLRYQNWLKARFSSIQELNRAYVEENVSFITVPPPGELLDRKDWSPPRNSKKYQDWLEFKKTLPAEFRIPIRVTRLWQEFLQGKFQGQFANVPKEVAGVAKSFETLSYPSVEVASPLRQEFLAKRLPADPLRTGAEARWKEAAASLSPTGNDDAIVEMPIAAYESSFVSKNTGELRQEFATRNYRYVTSYILLNGRAVVNTVLFCALVILTQLTVNPLAAFALSRFPIRSTGKILIFLLATMAFPAEVAMIPSFILLKDLGLLNTFAALVLPGAASGYMIYLLKGFFDSLPQELYESGQLDGAKEITMMWKIAFPLSRPVLGYLALVAFMGAYGAFLFAFLIAQDRSMWTLMVSMYQLQLVAPKAVVMAGLTIAALPTLLVFLAAQRVILRGIVLPGER